MKVAVLALLDPIAARSLERTVVAGFDVHLDRLIGRLMALFGLSLVVALGPGLIGWPAEAALLIDALWLFGLFPLASRPVAASSPVEPSSELIVLTAIYLADLRRLSLLMAASLAASMALIGLCIRLLFGLADLPILLLVVVPVLLSVLFGLLNRWLGAVLHILVQGPTTALASIEANPQLAGVMVLLRRERARRVRS